MKRNNEDISKLILLIDHAVRAYTKASTKHSDDHLEHFFEELSKNHKVFIKKAEKKYNISDQLPIKNQMTPEQNFEKESAIDQLILCIELEKAILAQAREVVHNNGFSQQQKRLLCHQLTFSEQMLFKADQMLEVYE